MGNNWIPGGSLRAFRDFLPEECRIYGADIDKRILFTENRIDTFFVDQTDLSSFDELSNNTPEKIDLIIDDGLHAPNANIALLSFSFNKLDIGGWVVIEDIAHEAAPFWQIVEKLIPPNYETYLIKAKKELVFAVQKIS